MKKHNRTSTKIAKKDEAGRAVEAAMSMLRQVRHHIDNGTGSAVGGAAEEDEPGPQACAAARRNRMLAHELLSSVEVEIEAAAEASMLAGFVISRTTGMDALREVRRCLDFGTGAADGEEDDECALRHRRVAHTALSAAEREIDAAWTSLVRAAATSAPAAE